MKANQKAKNQAKKKAKKQAVLAAKRQAKAEKHARKQQQATPPNEIEQTQSALPWTRVHEAWRRGGEHHGASILAHPPTF